ncbi:MAG: cobalamin B12-binding domain-containing protein [Chloroflexi bacterium]|nr:cobalamin B12-binding domain-containing protein [Chloroflexota bacterium]
MSEEVFDKLRQGILNFDPEAIEKAAKEVIARGLNALEAIDVLTGALREVGSKYEDGDAFLPEMMMAAEALKAGTAILAPAVPADEKMPAVGTFVIGTVKGDIHTIGKMIVGAMLATAGFNVVDIGIDQSPSAFAEAAEKNKANIVGASALMSTTRPGWKDIVEYFEALGIRDKYKIMVGGGGEHTRKYAEEAGVDGFGRDAVEAVRVALKLGERNDKRPEVGK